MEARLTGKPAATETGTAGLAGANWKSDVSYMLLAGWLPDPTKQGPFWKSLAKHPFSFGWCQHFCAVGGLYCLGVAYKPKYRFLQ